MNNNLPDISSRDDIVLLLNEFYGHAQKDPIIGDKFDHINIKEHTEIIANFWDSVLFGTNLYHGDPFGKHLNLKLAAKDFTKWLSLFNQTIDKNYRGPIADEAKYRAGTIAKVFQHKLGLV
jgi:hemoglobin